MTGPDRDTTRSVDNITAFKNGKRLAVGAVKVSSSDLSNFDILKVKFTVEGKDYNISQPLKYNLQMGVAETQKYMSELKEFKSYAQDSLGIVVSN